MVGLLAEQLRPVGVGDLGHVDIATGIDRDAVLVAQRKTAHKTLWTKDDVRELKAHSKARTPLPVIAKKMKRTERALGVRREILGIGLGHRR